MKIDITTFNQIASALSAHFVSVYYVEIETGKFFVFSDSRKAQDLDLTTEGEDFFAYSRAKAGAIVHPDDLDMLLKMHDKNTVMEYFEKNRSFTWPCRLVIDGKIVHVRHVEVLCDDKKHLICCMEDIEAEFQEKEQQKRNMQLAQLQARRDELTGVRNKNAFTEETRSIDEKINAGEMVHPFGVVVCDINNLKLINDTRGHSFGDEAIQKASRMICEVFKHSPVFRIGGDEFAVILSEKDFGNRESLLKDLKHESQANGRTHVGPVVACGLATYDPKNDKDFCAVFERADAFMYKNKKAIKDRSETEVYTVPEGTEPVVPMDRKIMLDSLFGALYTVTGGGYVFLNDMKHDYSRWSLPMVDDFGAPDSYLYHADRVMQKNVHPDDAEQFKEAVNTMLRGNAKMVPLVYRTRRTDGAYITVTTRGFVLKDQEGKPDFFGGIIIPS